MSDMRREFDERQVEVDLHLDLLEALERRSLETENATDDFRVEVRQVLILKASVLVHLYNLVEATMSLCFGAVEKASAEHSPKEFAPGLFEKWVVNAMAVGAEINIANVNKRAQEMGRFLISENASADSLSLKRTDGNWDFVRIVASMKAISVDERFSPALRRRLHNPFFDDLGPLEYVKARRNQLAHGLRTFEMGADNKTVRELRALANVVIEFLIAVIAKFDRYIEHRRYLADPQVAVG